MSSRDFPIAGPDRGHDFPLSAQDNLTHVPMLVVVAPGTTDEIIRGNRDNSSQRSQPVFQHPGDNRQNAIRAAA